MFIVCCEKSYTYFRYIRVSLLKTRVLWTRLLAIKSKNVMSMVGRAVVVVGRRWSDVHHTDEEDLERPSEPAFRLPSETV